MAGSIEMTTDGSAVEPTKARSRAGVFLAVLALAVAVMVGAWAWQSGGQAAIMDEGPLPVGPAIPDFALIRQDGDTVTRDTLRGRVWVADFIFTRCAGPCPELTARMRSLQLALEERADHVQLVSVTLDPKFDTPSVLRHYAKRFHADTEVWWFLTGDSERDVHELVRKGFLQTVLPATDEDPLIHSNYLLVIDQAGRIRASYDGLEPKVKRRILANIDTLLAETPDS